MTPWAYERIGEPGKVPMPDIRGPIAVIDPEDSGQGVQPMEPEDVDGWLLWDGYALIDYAGECVAVMLDPPTVQRPADMVPDIDLSAIVGFGHDDAWSGKIIRTAEELIAWLDELSSGEDYRFWDKDAGMDITATAYSMWDRIIRVTWEDGASMEIAALPGDYARLASGECPIGWEDGTGRPVNHANALEDKTCRGRRTTAAT